jgi:hypothetical protein
VPARGAHHQHIPAAPADTTARPGRLTFKERKPAMTVNASTFLDPALGAGYHAEEELARRARILCRTPLELKRFLEAAAADIEARFGTPEGPDADDLYSEPARDLMDTIEGWLDDLTAAFTDLPAFAEVA